MECWLLTVKEYMYYYSYVSGTDGCTRQAISWRIRNNKELPGVIEVMRKGHQNILSVQKEVYDYVYTILEGYVL